MVLLTFMLGGRVNRGRHPTGWETQPLRLPAYTAISLSADYASIVGAGLPRPHLTQTRLLYPINYMNAPIYASLSN